MSLKITYLNDDLDPIGVRSIDENEKVIDTIIEEYKVWGKLSIEDQFKYLSIEIWSHKEAGLKRKDLDPYHLVFEIDLPIKIDQQWLRYNLMCMKIENDMEQITQILGVPEIHNGQGIVTTPSGKGYMEWINVDNMGLLLAKPLKESNTVADALKIAKALEDYLDSCLKTVQKSESGVGSVMPPDYFKSESEEQSDDSET